MLLRQHRAEPVPLDPLPEPLRPLVAAGMAKDAAGRPTDAVSFVADLGTAATGAYGRDWQEHGRSHLGEAALLLALLWPSGPPPTVQGTTVQQVQLGQPRMRRARLRRPRLRHIGPVKAAISVGVIAVVAAGTALAANGLQRPAASHRPLAVVQSVSLHPTPPVSTSPQPSPSVSLSPPASSPESSSPPASTMPGAPPVSTAPVAPPVSTAPVAPPVSTAPVAPPPCTPQIATVGAFEASATQRVSITGSCFGTGNATSGADTAYFRISDLTAGWNGCWLDDQGTDYVTCDISSWTDQGITFSGYTGDYGQGTWVVATGDDIEIQVWNPQSGNGPATCEVVAGSEAPANCSGG
jgi:serine/threonine-protein kinase